VIKGMCVYYRIGKGETMINCFEEAFKIHSSILYLQMRVKTAAMMKLLTANLEN
jgi:hypothetical protein